MKIWGLMKINMLSQEAVPGMVRRERVFVEQRTWRERMMERENMWENDYSVVEDWVKARVRLRHRCCAKESGMWRAAVREQVCGSGDEGAAVGCWLIRRGEKRWETKGKENGKGKRKGKRG